MKREFFVSRLCALTKTKPLYGNRVSHAQNKTRHRFLPNLQRVHIRSEALGLVFYLRITAKMIRTLDKLGGLDAFLLKTRTSKLPSYFVPLKRKLKALKNVNSKQKSTH